MSEFSKILARFWVMLLLCVLSGCGAAAGGSKSAEMAGGMPGAPAPEAPAADAVTAEAAPAAAPAPPPPVLYAAKPQSVGGADGRLAQADKAAAADKRPDTTPTGGEPASGEKVVAAPMLIYSADLQLAVFETKKAMDALEKLARESGGYLVRRDMTSITFRIP